MQYVSALLTQHSVTCKRGASQVALSKMATTLLAPSAAEYFYISEECHINQMLYEANFSTISKDLL